MKLFEDIACNLCGSSKNKEIYKSKQYSHSFGELDIRLVMCEECSFIYQNPQLTSEALNHHYANNSSGAVYREYSANSRGTALINERKKFVNDIINQSNFRNICDIGGGNGAFLSSLEIDKSIKKILIEPSEAIHKNKDKSIVKIQKQIEDVKEEEFGRFDFLMCISALEHFKNPNFLLGKMCDLLSEGGVLFLEIPNSEKPHNTLAEFYSYEHVNHFTYESLDFLIKKHNLYPIKIDESDTFKTIRILLKKYKLKYILEKTEKIFVNYLNSKNKNKENINKVLNNKNRISIYGAGEHTRYLLENFNLLEKVDYFIDSDSKKWGTSFFDRTVLSPMEIKEKKITDILISSHDFEKEIYDTINKFANNINIFTIYDKGENNLGY